MQVYENKVFDINEWQKKNVGDNVVSSVQNAGAEKKLAIFGLGIAEEAGEVAGKIKKFFREDYTYDQTREFVLLELGDVLWYVGRIATWFGFTLQEVAEANTAKLIARQQRGTLQGSGDKR